MDDEHVEEVIRNGWNNLSNAYLANNITQCRRNLAKWKKGNRNHSGEQIDKLKRLLELEF